MRLQKRKQQAFTLLFLLLFVAASAMTYFLLTKNWTKTRPVQSADKPGLEDVYFQPEKSEVKSALAEVVNKSLDGAKGKYAIVIDNFTTGETYNFRENEVLPSASLYKLWVMASTFGKISRGELERSDILSENVADINSRLGISSDAAELTEGQLVLTVGQAIEQMIEISHNYSAYLLTNKVPYSQVNADLANFGLKNSQIGSTPTTTASDIAKFLIMLHRGQIVNPSYSREMVEILSKQQRNEGIPKYLPTGLEIAHKTGEIDYYKHNAGLVSGPGLDYVIVVLSESDSPYGAEERIAVLSKDVYEYFAKTAKP